MWSATGLLFVRKDLVPAVRNFIEYGMPFMRLSQNSRRALELEVVPREARLELTRIIRDWCSVPHGDDDGVITLLRENEFINIANQVMGKPTYVLEGGDWGEYHPAEHAWHHGQRELIMRLPSTPQLAEILADYIQRGMMNMQQINSILAYYHCGFSYKDSGDFNERKVSVEITAEDTIPEVDLSENHPNVRKLVARMESALSQQDYGGVLHASASVFETLAKDVMQDRKVSGKPLGKFFAEYRERSLLPDAILDYMYEIYKNRNREPLAGHGSLSEPSISANDAIVLCELTKTIVRTERSLADQRVDLNETGHVRAAAPKTSREIFTISRFGDTSQ